jgi:disulfide bond formation protein DsbB
VSRGGELRGRLALGARRLQPAVPVLVIAALLALVPFSTCAFRIFLHIPCPACGLTRATLAVARGDLTAALRYNPLSPALILVTAATTLAAFVADDAAWRRIIVTVTAGAGAALMIVWTLRFFGLFGGPVPG